MKYGFKILLLGDGNVGKTTLRRKFFGEAFKTNYLPTIGADFSAKKVVLKQGEIAFQVWDLAGQPTYSGVRNLYYQGGQGAIIVFDVTNRGSFESIPKWINEFWANNKIGVTPLVLLANKTDLRSSTPHSLTLDETLLIADDLATKVEKFHIPFKFYETSAITGKNVKESFECIGDAIFTFFKKFEESKLYALADEQ